MSFVLVGTDLLHIEHIVRVDFAKIEDLVLTIYTKDGKSFQVEALQTIELLMAIKPSALESRRLRWKKRAWMVHNMIGHPLMQLAALFGAYKLAMAIHDLTVPRPLGRKLWTSDSVTQEPKSRR